MWLHQETHSIIDLKLCLHLHLRMSPVSKQRAKVGGQLNQFTVKINSASHVPALIRKDAVMFPQQHAWVCCIPPDYFCRSEVSKVGRCFSPSGRIARGKMVKRRGGKGTG